MSRVRAHAVVGKRAVADARDRRENLAELHPRRIPPDLCAAGRVIDRHARDAGKPTDHLLIEPDASGAAHALEQQGCIAAAVGAHDDEGSLKDRVVVRGVIVRAARIGRRLAGRLFAQPVVRVEARAADGNRDGLAPRTAEGSRLTRDPERARLGRRDRQPAVEACQRVRARSHVRTVGGSGRQGRVSWDGPGRQSAPDAVRILGVTAHLPLTQVNERHDASGIGP